MTLGWRKKTGPHSGLHRSIKGSSVFTLAFVCSQGLSPYVCIVNASKSLGDLQKPNYHLYYCLLLSQKCQALFQCQELKTKLPGSSVFYSSHETHFLAKTGDTRGVNPSRVPFIRPYLEPCSPGAKEKTYPKDMPRGRAQFPSWFQQRQPGSHCGHPWVGEDFLVAP